MCYHMTSLVTHSGQENVHTTLGQVHSTGMQHWPKYTCRPWPGQLSNIPNQFTI